MNILDIRDQIKHLLENSGIEVTGAGYCFGSGEADISFKQDETRFGCVQTIHYTLTISES